MRKDLVIIFKFSICKPTEDMHIRIFFYCDNPKKINNLCVKK